MKNPFGGEFFGGFKYWHMRYRFWENKQSAVMTESATRLAYLCRAFATCLQKLCISVLKDDGQAVPVSIDVQALDGQRRHFGQVVRAPHFCSYLAVSVYSK